MLTFARLVLKLMYYKIAKESINHISVFRLHRNHWQKKSLINISSWHTTFRLSNLCSLLLLWFQKSFVQNPRLLRKFQFLNIMGLLLNLEPGKWFHHYLTARSTSSDYERLLFHRFSPKSIHCSLVPFGKKKLFFFVMEYSVAIF